MTLLVLDVRLPELVDPSKPGAIWQQIGDLWPQFFAYVLSFAVLALNWVFHHRKFRVIRSYDAGLIWINLVFLLFVAVLPFPTSVLSDYGSVGDAGVVLYAAEVGILSGLQTWLWVYAARHGHLDPRVTPRVAAYITRANAVPTVLFFLSIPAILFVPSPVGDFIAYALWFLTWPVGTLVDRWGARQPAEAAT